MRNVPMRMRQCRSRWATMRVRILPFYYALADAFTVCDQGYLRSDDRARRRTDCFSGRGTIRDQRRTCLRVLNAQDEILRPGGRRGRRFPIASRRPGSPGSIYQNEICHDSGLPGEEAPWLGNFTGNPIEWFRGVQRAFAKSLRAYLPSSSPKHPVGSLRRSMRSSAPDRGCGAENR